MNSKVTWLLPIKNGMPYLTECLQSIYNQSYTNHHVLAWVNDCDDNSLEELNNWIPKKIKGEIVSDEPYDNLGECLARMVEYAKTEFLARIDCDDVNHKNRLKEQVKMMQKSQNTVAVSSWINIINENGNFISLGKKPSNKPDFIMWDLLFRNPLYHPSMLLRKSKILDAGNYSNLKTAQDYDLWLRLARHGKIRTVEKPLINYRKVKDSVSKKYHKERKSIESKLFSRYASYFFQKEDKKDLIKLWNALSKHSNTRGKISINFYLRLLNSFCEKNNINIIDFLKNILLIRQYLNIKISPIFNFVYLIASLISNNRKYIDKILK